MGNKPWTEARMITTSNFTQMIENAEAADAELASTAGESQGQFQPEDRLVQLYNVDTDQYPNVVNAMLYRLANYYDEQEDPYYPPEDMLADPNLHGGVWKAWVE